jgi:hypothetical protein
MSAESVKTEVAPVEQNVQADVKQNDKEYNFARLRQEKERAIAAAEQAYAEKARLEAEIEKIRLQASKVRAPEFEENEDDDDEPYVNRKGLKKVLSKFDQNIESKIDERAQAIAKRILEEERQKNFVFQLKSEYRDFSDVVTADTLEKLQTTNPKMARIIDQMPDGYEKGQMVYETIKTMGLHKKPEPSVKEKVEQNMRNPYYYPSTAGHGSAQMGDYSEAGKKAAFDKVQALKSSRRSY